MLTWKGRTEGERSLQALWQPRELVFSRGRAPAPAALPVPKEAALVPRKGLFWVCLGFGSRTEKLGG